MVRKDTYIANDSGSELLPFLGTIQGIVQNHVDGLKVPIFTLNEAEQQALIDKINPYLLFELAQTPRVKDLPVEVSGSGMMFISSDDGSILGAEQISNGDILTGVLDEVWAYPVPTAECLILGDSQDEIPVVDQSLSGVVVLKGAKYKTGLNHDGTFQVEHDLGVFQVGLPLSHYLRFQEI